MSTFAIRTITHSVIAETVAIISRGGLEKVSSGGVASTTTILSRGILDVLSGGLADPTMVSSGGTEIVSARGTDFGAQVDGGGVQIVASGGTAISATLAGVEDLSHTRNLGVEVVSDGGRTIDTVISSGGAVVVSAGGMAMSTTVNSTGVGLFAGGLILSGGLRWHRSEYHGQIRRLGGSRNRWCYHRDHRYQLRRGTRTRRRILILGDIPARCRP
jgi:autotransporter passenger strand-loop-strand repeat protein